MSGRKTSTSRIDRKQTNMIDEYKLLLIDKTTKGSLGSLLAHGVRSINEALASSDRGSATQKLKVEEHTFAHFEIVKSGYDPRNSLVLVAVKDTSLSSVITVEEPVRLGSGRKQNQATSRPEAKKNTIRVPCIAIEKAQTILKSVSDVRLYLLVPSDPSAFSGLDIVAALLSGVAGIIDESSLVDPNTIRKIVDHEPDQHWNRAMVLVGRHLQSNLMNLKDLVESWNSDDTVEDRFRLPSWRAAIALAQLEKLLPSFGGGAVYAFTKFASALNMAKTKTLFEYHEDDLRKVLGILPRWLMKDEYLALGDSTLILLPDYARRAGFPRNPPAIQGLSDEDLSRQLYHAIQELEIELVEMGTDVPSSVIKFAPKNYRGRSKVHLAFPSN
jgi:hypothetical protein